MGAWRYGQGAQGRKPLLHKKILEYVELKNFKAFLKKQMHKDFERLKAEKGDKGWNPSGDDEVRVQAGQDSITMVLQFIRQYQRNFK